MYFGPLTSLHSFPLHVPTTHYIITEIPIYFEADFGQRSNLYISDHSLHYIHFHYMYLGFLTFLVLITVCILSLFASFSCSKLLISFQPHRRCSCLRFLLEISNKCSNFCRFRSPHAHTYTSFTLTFLFSIIFLKASLDFCSNFNLYKYI